MGTFQNRKGNAYFENVSFQELCANPQFIIGGATRTDVCQGELGMYSASEFCFRRKKNEASFKNSSYTDDFIGYLPDIVGERQVTPKKGTHGPALLPETGYTRAYNSYVKPNCLLEVGS